VNAETCTQWQARLKHSIAEMGGLENVLPQL
jgi:hypothetical protein